MLGTRLALGARLTVLRARLLVLGERPMLGMRLALVNTDRGGGFRR